MSAEKLFMIRHRGLGNWKAGFLFDGIYIGVVKDNSRHELEIGFSHH